MSLLTFNQSFCFSHFIAEGSGIAKLQKDAYFARMVFFWMWKKVYSEIPKIAFAKNFWAV